MTDQRNGTPDTPQPATGPQPPGPSARPNAAARLRTALQPSATPHSGLRALPLPGTDAPADAALLTDGQDMR